MDEKEKEIYRGMTEEQLIDIILNFKNTVRRQSQLNEKEIITRALEKLVEKLKIVELIDQAKTNGLKPPYDMNISVDYLFEVIEEIKDGK